MDPLSARPQRPLPSGTHGACGRMGAEQGIEQTLAPGIHADQLNDDALGQVLERMAQMGPAMVDQTCLRILTLFGDPKSLYNDTSSLRLWGAYEHPESTDPLTIHHHLRLFERSSRRFAANVADAQCHRSRPDRRRPNGVRQSR